MYCVYQLAVSAITDTLWAGYTYVAIMKDLQSFLTTIISNEVHSVHFAASENFTFTLKSRSPTVQI